MAKPPKNYKERKTVQVNGQTYVRDGSRLFPLADVEAAGGNFNALDPNSSISYQGTVNQQMAGGGPLNGPWAQIAAAGGLGQMQRGWTRNNPALFSLAQNLGYGHVRMGANGTFVSEGQNGNQITHTVFDNQGNVISQGNGPAPENLYDRAAQQKFESAARDSILSRGGALALRLKGQQPAVGGAAAPLTQSITNVPPSPSTPNPAMQANPFSATKPPVAAAAAPMNDVTKPAQADPMQAQPSMGYATQREQKKKKIAAGIQPSYGTANPMTV